MRLYACVVCHLACWLSYWRLVVSNHLLQDECCEDLTTLSAYVVSCRSLMMAV